MKLNELKHNHSLTDLLKILIFSVLMLTPLLSIATRCLYVICNKNAYESYSGKDVTNVEYYNDTLPIETYLQSYLNGSTTYYNTGYFVVSDLTIIKTNTSFNTENVYYLRYYSNKTVISFDDQYNILSNIEMTSNKFLNIQFKINSHNINTNELGTMFSYTNSGSFNYMDNVFEYSIGQLENSEYYNWTQNTAIYTGVKAMTTNLQIEGNVIPILITYWFLLTVIYVIIDIVLKCFTTLTHLIGNKKV